jgi:Na+/H+ antiporter NhaD/arsenite permease-like protein
VTVTAWIAVAVFAAAYVFIATEKIHRVAAALGGAVVMFLIGATDARHAFFAEDSGIDWNVLFLLLGMMLIVAVLRRTGAFEYLAIWAVKRAKGRPFRVMAILVLVTAVASAMLDNVTTVLLIAPVTLLVCDRLGVKPTPFLIAEVFASNIGGAATLVGDPPNIIIASRAGLSFNDFLVHMAPIAVIALIVLMLTLPVLFRGSFTVDPGRVVDVMALNEREAIRDPRLLAKSGVVLVGVFAAFIGHSIIHVEPSVVALLGAGVLVLISRVDREDYLGSVEWETLLFFVGLFILVGGLVKTGAIAGLARLAADVTGGNALFATMLILIVSALLSGVIDNIPYVATMSPVVADLVTSISDPAQSQALWWALAIGADFGGNLTAVGASANVVMLGIAAREGHPISFWEFTRKGAIVTALTIGVAAPYLWLRYFVLA